MLKKRSKDLALEVLVGTVLVGGYVFYLIKGGTVNWPLAEVGLNTLMVFGFLIAWFRPAWAERNFWLVLLALLILHAAAYHELWRRTELKFSNGKFVVIDMVELSFFSIILNRLTSRGLRPSPDSGRQ